MRRLFRLLALCATAALVLSGCSREEPAEERSFAIDLTCESAGVYQIFYTYYIDGVSCGIGGVADLDGGELTDKSDLTIVFPEGLFEENGDISKFSIDFSPYGEGDTSELGTTNRLEIDAEYGQTYAVRFSGDTADGFSAALVS